MKLSKRGKYVLISLLVLLNFVIRIPSVPHETGIDSFSIHILANSISTFSGAQWWVNTLSVFGYYTEYTYASAVPFILSGISQCTGLEMELTMWLFSLIFGLFGAAAMYLLAGVIWNNDIFKFLAAFCYSLSPGILNFSTWDISTRGPFVILLPLFIYLLLKTRSSIPKYGILAFLFSILLMATHHYVAFIIPIIFCFIILILYNRLKRYFGFRMNFKIPLNPNDFANVAFILLFLAALIYPLVTGLFIEGNEFYWLDDMITSNIRYTGLLMVFIVGGFISLALKHDKRFGEWFFLFTLICLIPFIYIKTYAYTFFLVFTSTLIGIGLTNVGMAYHQHKNKLIATILIVSLLLSVCFSGYYQHWRTGSEKYGQMAPAQKDWYMREATYVGGLWIKDNINKNMVFDTRVVTRRIFAISEVPTLTGFGYCDIPYGFTTINDIDIAENSPLSTEFYMDNPYIVDYSEMYSRGEYSLADYIRVLHENTINSNVGKRTISKFNFSYVIEDEDGGDSVFIQSVHKKKDNIYSNGKILIWSLE